ncbi:MAG: PilZ domain-containing protein [Bdellovibrionales bacterium]|nr:PilZ domain-containing protein [Bdellovibrionales bacterium]
MMDGKRRDKRINQKRFVCFEGDGFQIFSQTKDISENGAFISTHYLLEPGTEIDVTFVDVQGEKPRKATVIHSPGDRASDVDQSGFGVELR